MNLLIKTYLFLSLNLKWKRIFIHTYVYAYIFMKKSRKKSKFDEFIMKVDVKRFGYKNLLQDFKFMK